MCKNAPNYSLNSSVVEMFPTGVESIIFLLINQEEKKLYFRITLISILGFALLQWLVYYDIHEYCSHTSICLPTTYTVKYTLYKKIR